LRRIDPEDSEHRDYLARVLYVLQYPHHCYPTTTAQRDMLRLRLSKGEVLDEIERHIRAREAIYLLVQTSGKKAYVLGCKPKGEVLYTKIQLDDAASRFDERMCLISVHEPEFPFPEE
jgi:hypothetical protein